MAVSKNKVRKMSPEEKTLIDNIKAMVSELEGAEAAEGEEDQSLKEIEQMAEGAPNEEEGMDEMKAPEEGADEMTDKPKMPVKMACKPGMKKARMSLAKEETPEDEGSTASDDAEERIEDDIPDQDKADIKAVARALQALTTRSRPFRPVRKSTDDVLSELTGVVKALAAQVVVQKTSMEKLLTQLGVAEQVTAAAAAEGAVQKSKPVGSLDTEAVAEMVFKALADVAQKKQSDRQFAPGDTLAEVRKDLSGAMTALWGVQQKQ